MKHIKKTLTLFLLLMVWGMGSAMAATALPSVTIVETDAGSGSVQFTVTVEDGYYLAGFAVTNDWASGTEINIASTDHTQGAAEGMIETWTSKVLLINNSKWGYFHQEGQNPPDFITSDGHEALSFFDALPTSDESFAFGYFFDQVGMGGPPELPSSVLLPGTYTGFFGSTSEMQSAFSAIVYQQNGVDGDGEPIYISSILTGQTSSVPVPATAWLLASGIISLVGLRRRKI